MSKNKKIIIVVVVIAVLVAIFALVKFFGGNNEINLGEGGSAGTGSNSYSTGKVAFTGTKKETTESGNTRTWTADVVFADNGYETTIYYKIVVDYLEMDDEKMLGVLKQMDPYGGSAMSPNYDGFNVNGTTELGIVEDYGMDTTVTRNGKTVTVTYYVSNYNGYEKLTSSDKETVKQSLKDAGFKVK